MRQLPEQRFSKRELLAEPLFAGVPALGFVDLLKHGFAGAKHGAALIEPGGHREHLFGGQLFERGFDLGDGADGGMVWVENAIGNVHFSARPSLLNALRVRHPAELPASGAPALLPRTKRKAARRGGCAGLNCPPCLRHKILFPE